MTGKWRPLLLESVKSGQMPGYAALKTFKTPDGEVSRVLRVPDSALSEENGTYARIVQVDILTYRTARQHLATDVQDGVSTLHRDQALTDADAFLEQWGATAARLGWTAADIFEPPGVWIGGLVWCIAGRRVVKLTEQVVTIDGAGRRSSYARPLPSSPSAQQEVKLPHCPPWRRGSRHQKP